VLPPTPNWTKGNIDETVRKVVYKDELKCLYLKHYTTHFIQTNHLMFKRDIVAAFKKISLQWITDLQTFSDERLYYKPSESEWCLAELYDHTMRVARTY